MKVKYLPVLHLAFA